MSLLTGGVDTHIHSAPSVIKRPMDDLELAAAAGKAGIRGIVLKTHESCSAARAYLAEKATGVRVYGGLCLNHSVGGLNPEAVETSLKMGGKFIWMPTISARNHRVFFSGPVGKKLGFALEGSGEGITILDGRGRLKEEVFEIIGLVARFDAVLATGHLGLEEVSKLAGAAREGGVRRIVFNHPDINFISAPLAAQKELAAAGVLMEKCFNLHLPPWLASTAAETASMVRDLGAEHCILSSDLGQMGNPMPVEGMEMFIRQLMENGLSERDITRMWVENPSCLVS